jgi:uncharacterized protein YndB with AHSA1/START domain
MKFPSILLIPGLLTTMARANEFDFTREIRVSATPQTVWKALVDPAQVKRYHLAPLREIELKKDGTITYGTADEVMISGKIMAVAENVKLAHTFRFGPASHPATDADPETTVTYEIRRDGDLTVLKLTHSGFTTENQTRANITGGWPFILGRLKEILDAKPTPGPRKD